VDLINSEHPLFELLGSLYDRFDNLINNLAIHGMPNGWHPSFLKACLKGRFIFGSSSAKRSITSNREQQNGIRGDHGKTIVTIAKSDRKFVKSVNKTVTRTVVAAAEEE
jgi:hypothetical protein